MTKLIPLSLAFILLSACSTAIPKMGLSDATPHSETAVFVAVDDEATDYRLSQIIAVDGRKTACAAQGCPPWVRVTNGSHEFTIRYSFSLDHTHTVTVENMKKGRIYVARRTENNNELEVHVEELPQGETYGLGLQADGTYKLPVTF